MATDNPLAPAKIAKAEVGRSKTRAAGRFVGQKSERVKARNQERELNRLGEVSFSDATTAVSLLGASTAADGRRVLRITESTEHPYTDGSGTYAYALDHTFKFIPTAGGWSISEVEVDDPLGLNVRTPRSDADMAETRRKTQSFVKEARAAKTVRDDANEAKARTERAGRSALTQAAGADTVLATVANTCYSCAASWAQKYAIAPPAVDYTRDDNDCTTFVSKAMNVGGWPEVTGFYSSSGAWWYNCDWCKPRHSYAWGGAQNFKTFVANSGRVNFLSNVWQVGLADIIQYDVKNYGGVGTADHTMIVTSFDSSGNPRLSYHTTDTRDKPLIQILQSSSAAGQTFWAERT